MTDPSLIYALLAACGVLVVGLYICQIQSMKWRYLANGWKRLHRELSVHNMELEHRLGNRKRDPKTGRWMK